MNPSESPSGLYVRQEDLLPGSSDDPAAIRSENDRSLSVKRRDEMGGSEAGRSGEEEKGRCELEKEGKEVSSKGLREELLRLTSS